MPATESADRPQCAVAVDLVVLTVRDGELCTLLGRRSDEPFAGQWALPGGFVAPTHGLDAAARHVLDSATGIGAGVEHPRVHIEQLASYGDPGRDPRERVVTIAYLALVPGGRLPNTGTEAGRASWTPVCRAIDDGTARSAGPTGRISLAFDHARILADGVERARAKLEYSSLAAALCPEQFTVGELRRVYEAVWGVVLDPRNFHRKITGTPDFLIPVGGTTSRQGGRPAQLFRRGAAVLLNPPMLRPER
jgi:8-oxo-dGTP diphosphatase